MASPPTRCTWVWMDSRSWWWTGRPGVVWFMGSQRVGHDWATELNSLHRDISYMKSWGWSERVGRVSGDERWMRKWGRWRQPGNVEERWEVEESLGEASITGKHWRKMTDQETEIFLCQASLSITNSWSLPKLMSITSVMPFNHLILWHPFLLGRTLGRLCLKAINGKQEVGHLVYQEDIMSQGASKIS